MPLNIGRKVPFTAQTNKMKIDLYVNKKCHKSLILIYLFGGQMNAMMLEGTLTVTLLCLWHHSIRSLHSGNAEETKK